MQLCGKKLNTTAGSTPTCTQVSCKDDGGFSGVPRGFSTAGSWQLESALGPRRNKGKLYSFLPISPGFLVAVLCCAASKIVSYCLPEQSSKQCESFSYDACFVSMFIRARFAYIHPSLAQNVSVVFSTCVFVWVPATGAR